MENRNSQLEHGNKRLVLHMRLRCGSLSINTPVSLLTHEFDVRGILQEQASLAAVNQFCVIHEAMDGCENIRIHYRISSKM